MEKFIDYKKLSKKEQKKINALKRKTWSIDPKTKVTPNPKAYNRAKEKRVEFN